MNTIDLGAAGAYACFARHLLEHKSDIGMEDVPDAELVAQAPTILGALVRISIGALREPDEPDNVRRIAALDWFLEWASHNVEAFPEAAFGVAWRSGNAH